MLIIRNIVATIVCVASLLLNYAASINNFYRWDSITDVVRGDTIINLPIMSILFLVLLIILWSGKLDED